MKWLALLALFHFACAFQPKKVSQRTQVLMGTSVTVVLPEKHQNLHFQSFEIIKDLQQKLSTYDPSSEISQLNRSREVNASPLTIEILTKAIYWSRETGNYFHPGIGRLTENFKNR